MTTRKIESVLLVAARGDESAYGLAISLASDRLLQMARRMLRNYPDLKRWEQTDDVFQNAAVRLHRSLSRVQPDSLPRFMGLAATEIRRTLIDLARHHFGPEGIGARHHSDAEGQRIIEHSAPTDAPETLEEWTQFHEAVGRLPDDAREVFELVWFSGLQQHEIANLLDVSARTVKRRWRAAKLLLHEHLGRLSETVIEERDAGLGSD